MKTPDKVFVDLISKHQKIIHKVCNVYCHTLEDRQDTENTIVTIVLMAIGFIIGYAALKINQQSQLVDLETSLEILNNESGESLQFIS